MGRRCNPVNLKSMKSFSSQSICTRSILTSVKKITNSRCQLLITSMKKLNGRKILLVEAIRQMAAAQNINSRLDMKRC